MKILYKSGRIHSCRSLSYVYVDLCHTIIIISLGCVTNRLRLGGSMVKLLFHPRWIPCNKVVSQNLFKVLYVWKEQHEQ